MAFSSGGGSGPMADINVTPLVDVMLVLLIIFMVAAVPAVMAFNFFARKIKVLTAEMDAFGNDFLNIVKRHFLR